MNTSRIMARLSSSHPAYRMGSDGIRKQLFHIRCPIVRNAVPAPTPVSLIDHFVRDFDRPLMADRFLFDIDNHPLLSDTDFIIPQMLAPEQRFGCRQRSPRAQRPRRFFAAENSLCPQNMVEKEDNYQITTDMPGMVESDIKITIDNGFLHISGERHFDADSNSNLESAEAENSSVDKESSDTLAHEKCDTSTKEHTSDNSSHNTEDSNAVTAPKNVKHRRNAVYYNTSLKLPKNITDDSSAIVANYVNGVLSIQVPKKEQIKAQRIQINVNN